jgi:hypothetical protein
MNKSGRTSFVVLVGHECRHSWSGVVNVDGLGTRGVPVYTSSLQQMGTRTLSGAVPRATIASFIPSCRSISIQFSGLRRKAGAIWEEHCLRSLPDRLSHSGNIRRLSINIVGPFLDLINSITVICRRWTITSDSPAEKPVKVYRHDELGQDDSDDEDEGDIEHNLRRDATDCRSIHRADFDDFLETLAELFLIQTLE